MGHPVLLLCLTRERREGGGGGGGSQPSCEKYKDVSQREINDKYCSAAAAAAVSLSSRAMSGGGGYRVGETGCPTGWGYNTWTEGIHNITVVTNTKNIVKLQLYTPLITTEILAVCLKITSPVYRK